MRSDTVTLKPGTLANPESPATSNPGTATDTEDFDQMTLYVSGTFVATAQLMASPDGEIFLPLGDPITEEGVYVLEKIAGGRFRAQQLRVDITAFTSGAPVFQLMSRNLRTDC